MINWSWSVVDPNNVVNIHVFAEIVSVNYIGSLYCAEERTNDTTARVSSVTKAADILDKLLDDPKLGQSGRRNDDAVDISIALWVLGIDSPSSWLEHTVYEQTMVTSTWSEWLDHLERVEGYLESWGPKDKRDEALRYLVRNHY